MRESAIERYFVLQVNKMGGLALKLTSSNMSGLPDRLVLLPNGALFFVELKTTGKQLRPLQRAIHARLTTLGFAAYTIDSKEGVQEVLKRYAVQTPQIPRNSN